MSRRARVAPGAAALSLGSLAVLWSSSLPRGRERLEEPIVGNGADAPLRQPGLGCTGSSPSHASLSGKATRLRYD
jgi:hypothetical protein